MAEDLSEPHEKTHVNKQLRIDTVCIDMAEVADNPDVAGGAGGRRLDAGLGDVQRQNGGPHGGARQAAAQDGGGRLGQDVHHPVVLRVRRGRRRRKQLPCALDT
jgi:hypothetical protein